MTSVKLINHSSSTADWNNLFVHKRVETGFMPKEYLEELFIGKKKKIDKN